MSRADEKLERAASRLDEAARQAAAQGGFKAKLGELLADDAAFLRQVKPSLIAARARGELPTDRPPGQGVVGPSAASAPSAPQLGPRPKPPGSGGPNVFAVVAAALAVGILIARVIDWRSHAHPRR